jgi:hypothetical protein
MFNKKEINKDCPHKPIGCTKKPIRSIPCMELDIPTECYVSIEPPCDPGAFGARVFFEKYGYMIIRNIWDPKDFKEEPPKERGQINYYGKENKFSVDPIERQVNGSLARYRHPKFSYAHSQIRLKLEKILGEELYNTYYYDRFYFKGQRLYRHTDRDACEISLTYQISSNSNEPWPIYFQTPDGEEKYVELKDGDAILYKGRERDHWREPLKSRYGRIKRMLNKISFKKDDTYHHQIFFHYVRMNGDCAHCAFDASK